MKHQNKLFIDHRAGGLGVVGSNPATPTIHLIEFIDKKACLSAGRRCRWLVRPAAQTRP
jgi:hypothetical protein